MNKCFLILVIFGVVSVLSFSSGCRNQASQFQLFELAGDFQTRDINKAQMEIPFPIITPDYIPKSLNSPPVFKGTLRRYQIDVSSNLTAEASTSEWYSGAFSNNAENLEIQITYSGKSSYLNIEESRKQITLGEPEYNPNLKYVDILGTKAIFAEGSEGQGSSAYLSFQREGLSFLLQSDNIPNTEVVSVAKSMLAKTLPIITISNPEEWPWGEAYGRYYTNDITTAQKETKFLIIAPTYVPETFVQRSPNIEGPLTSLQSSNINTIKLLFFTAVVRESTTGTYSVDGGPTQKSQDVLPVILEISEQSTPFSGQPDIAANVELNPIPGRDMYIWTQDVGDMQCGGVTFKQGEIYIDVRFYDLALDEVIKVVESLLSQN